MDHSCHSSPAAAPSDEAFAGSHREVVGTLVDHHRQFLAFLERRVGSRALAEDILQDAFVRGIEHEADLQNPESAIAWFYRVLRNAVIDHYRHRGTGEKALEKLAREMETQAEPDAELHATVCQCINGLAGTLKPEYSDALQQIEVGGMKVQDFAGQAGIGASNASVRLHRAREALRKRVVAACGTCATHGCFNCTCEQSGGECG